MHTRPIVFVVDDDVSVREALEVLIRDAGWEPETFASAREFISRGGDLLDGRRYAALRKRYTSLSERERQVLTLVISGLLNKQIGGKLGISEITVKAHRGHVMRKMEADSLADLVNMAGRLGITHSTPR